SGPAVLRHLAQVTPEAGRLARPFRGASARVRADARYDVTLRTPVIVTRGLSPWSLAFRSEAIVEAESDQVAVEAVIGAGHGVGTTGEAHVDVFGLPRPVLRERVFGAGADCPADMAAVLFQRVELSLKPTESQTAGCVKQQIVPGRNADAPAQGAEPRIGELPRSE